MSGCYIKFGASGASQQQLIAKLSGNKIDVIQTASGLCARASVEAVRKLLEGEDGVSVVNVDHKDMSPDVAKFLGGK